MKHNVKIVVILLSMFIITQFIGMYVVNYYLNEDNELPYGLETPEIEKESDYRIYGFIFFIAFVIAIFLLFLLTKFNLKFILKAWFFVVIVIALAIFFNSIFGQYKYGALSALIIALPLAFMKIYKKNFLIHNTTELLVYPGIAAIFVPLFNLWIMILILILISIYDMWAVWHSGIMQKMAKYQINKLNIFPGFFVPYLSKKMRLKIQKMKKSMKKSELKKKKIKVNIAILGGGDIIFPIIAAGVILKTGSINLPFGLSPFLGGFLPALFVIFGATLGLGYLFLFSKKKKFYPAMPFITAGIFAGIILSYLIL